MLFNFNRLCLTLKSIPVSKFQHCTWLALRLPNINPNFVPVFYFCCLVLLCVCFIRKMGGVCNVCSMMHSCAGKWQVILLGCHALSGYSSSSIEYCEWPYCPSTCLGLQGCLEGSSSEVVFQTSVQCSIRKVSILTLEVLITHKS